MYAYLKSEKLGPISDSTLSRLLIRSATDSEVSKKGIIFVDEKGNDTKETYGDLYQNSLRVLSSLNKRGIKKNDFLIFQVKNEINFIRLFWGCILGGIIPIPISIPLSLSSGTEAFQKLLRISNQLSSPFIVTEEQIFESFKKEYYQNNLRYIFYDELMNDTGDKAELVSLKADDIAYIQYSSGSTGDPKGVILTNTNLLHNLTQLSKRICLSNYDFAASWMPLTHDMGLVGFHLSPMTKGIDHIIMSSDTFIKKPALFLKKIKEYKVTQFASPNFGMVWMNDKIKEEDMKDIDLSSVRLIYDGAEPISMDVVRGFNEKFKQVGLKPNTVYQVYGMAEACVAVTFPEVGEYPRSVIIDRNNNRIGNDVKFISKDEQNAVEFAVVGKPLDGIEVKIVDDEDKLLFENQVGNILIKGLNVSKGYFFQKNNFYNSEGFYHTGDIGFVNNERLVITGRKKDILFINGQNYYSHDIENILQGSLPNEYNQTAVCSYFNNEKAKDVIVIFVRYRKNLKSFIPICQEVQNILFQRAGFFADYVLPIKSIPKTTSGKPQRYKLVEQFANSEYEDIIKEIACCLINTSQDEYKSKPILDNAIANKIMDLAKKTLKIEKIGPYDDFIRLGLDSIKLIHFANELQNEFKISIPINKIISLNNMEKLCDYIINCSGELYSLENIYSYARGSKPNEPFDLTEVQMAYLMGRKNGFEMGGFSTHAYYELETELDIKRFNDALNCVIKRQPMLRAVVFEGGKQQVLEKVPEYNIFIEDISMLEIHEKEVRIEAERERMSHFVFQSDKWPLFEFKAFCISPNKHYIHIGFDMLIIDGSSIFLMLKEIMEYYNQPELIKPELEFLFCDYIHSYNILKTSSVYKRDLEYWNGKTADFPPAPQLSLIKQPEEVDRPYFKRIQKAYPQDYWVLVKKIAKENGITPSAMLCTIYAEVLCKWTNQPHMAINFTVFNRYPFHPDVMQIIGDFTSVMLIDIDLKSSSNFWERAQKVQKTIFEALEHRHYSGVDFIRDIAHENSLSGKSVMPIVFTSMLFGESEYEFPDFSGFGELKNGVSQTPQVYLDFQIMENGNNFTISWDYVSDILNSNMIENMFKEYTIRLEAISRNSTYCWELTEEDSDFISRYNMTDEFIETGLLHLMIDRQIEKTPEAIAVKLGDEFITYSELGSRSNQIARYLTEKGFSRGNFIGVLAERKIETIVNIVGILKAGCAYVPINPEFPEDRKNFILKHSDCKDLLEPELYKNKKLSALNSSKLELQNEPDDIAYVIYTSGSTGMPKGVVITHKAVTNTILDINNKFNVGQEDKIIGLSSMCFDLSVYDIFGALISGAQLVMIPSILDVNYMEKVIQDEGITIWNSVPAILNMLIDNMSHNSCEPAYWEVNQDYNANVNFNDSLRVIMLSGDWIPLGLVGGVREIFPFADIISLGGATEASIWSIYYPIMDVKKDWKSIPYGYPLANQKFYVLDYQMEYCPVGVMGELYIGGIGVALGYLNDLEKTQNAFIKHPELGYIYKTGDYGILHSEGYIEFMGRKDHQVKINGFRIELGEIENCISNITGVKNAVVADKTNSQGKKYLCAYVIKDETVSLDSVKEKLRDKLPNYMVPEVFTELQEIPLNSNGKVDRKNLPDAEVVQSQTCTKTEPRNEVERKLVSIWESILNIQNIGIDDDFFEIGGDSLKGANLIARMHKEMNAEVPLREIFQKPTIRGMAKYVRSTTTSLFSEIQTVEKKEYYEVSSSQRRMFILNQLDKKSINYNTPGIVEIEGQLDKEYVQEVVNKLVQRHEAFRTSFIIVNGEVFQKIKDEDKVEVEYFDISDEESNKDEKTKDIVKSFIRPFELSMSPLLRSELIKVQDERYILMFDTHHIVSDAISKEIIVKEFADIYNKKELDKLRIQYKDYAVWQNNAFKSDKYKSQMEYWVKQFQGNIPSLNLPTDYIRPSLQSFEGDRIYYEIDSSITEGIKRIKENTGTTLYMVLLAALNVVLFKFSNQEDIVIGTPVAGRPHSDLENIIGIFVNTLSMRNKPEGQKSFREFLNEVKENTLNAIENQDYPFEELVEKVNVGRDISRNPLFDVFFALQNIDVDKPEITDIKITPYNVENKISKFDISVYAYEIEDTIKLEFEYCTKLYNRETIERLANAYKKVMLEVLENENIKIKEIEAISEIEKEKLLKEFNSTEANYQKEKAVHELFEEQVERNPDSIALTYESKQLTYKELNIRSNQLAETLREKGVGAESIVAVMVGRSLEMIIGILAVLKAGGGYLPIDPEYPEERISFMLEDSGTKIVLTQSEYKHNVCEGIEAIDLFENRAYSENSSNLSKVSGAAELAYVIYTSGSTGKPKGVMIEHHSLHNFIMGVADCIEFSQGTKILAVTTISFDIFALETLLPLCKGLEVVIAGEEEQTSPKLLARLIKAKEIEMLQMTPSRMALLLDEMAEGDLDCVKTLMLGGEALPEGLLKRISRCCACRIYNMYGPTETTVWSSISEMTGKTKVDIGKPIANTQMFILDSENRLCPIGVSGELCISGDGLARGYLNRQELTEEKFIRNPYASDSRIYRTGDIARWLPDGIIECLGRSDYQIKLRGYRIELGEIEEQLIKMEGIKEAAVAVKDNDKGEKYLCGYIVCDREITIKELREGLKKKLPEYMIPSHFMMLEKMPMTPNGKTDRKALPEPQGNMATGWQYEAARNELEQKLVEIWQEVLGIDKVGIYDNFFELGGNSMGVVKLSNMISEKLNQNIEVMTCFQYPSIISFTEYLLSTSEINKPNKIDLKKESEDIQISSENKEIAIVGMAGRYPKAKDLDEFWYMLKNAREGITHFSREELLEAGVSEELLDNPRYVKAASLLEGMEYFDAEFFGYTPSDAEIMDPQIRIFTECAWEALEDAGCIPEKYKGKIGLFAGASTNFYWQNMTFNRATGSVSEMFRTMQLNDKQFLPTQVSYKLNLKGPGVYVNTACSTSLVAVHLACQSLLNGECSVALAGGVNATQSQKEGYLYEEGMILSKDGYCRAFDDNASGTMFGNGVGVVVLKTLDKALRDKDHIYAVIKGSAVNNDGNEKIGYTAPSIVGQKDVIEKAIRISGVPFESIGYVETHGTGTALGDPIEVEALKQAYNTKQKKYCAIGSVKTNIGHTDVAAGISGFIKTVLALKERQIPASLNFNKPNQRIDFENSPFYVNTELKEWRNEEYPLRAGVSSFGIGGTNAHVILEEAPMIANSKKKRNYNILSISARTAKELECTQQKLREYFENNKTAVMEDVAYTLGIGRKEFQHRKAFVCESAENAIEILSNVGKDNVKAGTVREGIKTVTFMFPGQGAQYINMGKDLYENEELFCSEMNRCFDMIREVTGHNLKEILYGENCEGVGIDETEIAQLAIYSFEYSLSKLLMGWGIVPDIMIGHSIGEYVAATVAGVIELEDCIRLIAVRGKLMQEMSRGQMLSIMQSEAEVKELINGEVSIAAVNSTKRCVVSGKEEDIITIEENLKNQGIGCIRLKTSHAYHSPMMAKAAERFMEHLKKIKFSEPKIRYFSNITGTWVGKEVVAPEYWVKHMLKTVRFESAIGEILKIPNAVFIEVGPGRALTTFVREHEKYAKSHTIVSLIRHIKEEKQDQQYLCEKISELWVNGVNIDWEEYYRDCGVTKVALPTYPFSRKKYWLYAGKNGLGNPFMPKDSKTVFDEEILMLEDTISKADIELERTEISTAFCEAETELEKKLIEIEQEIFGFNGIGLDDNFFELGGDSLKAIMLMTKIHKSMDIKLTVQDIFHSPTIREIAQHIELMTNSVYSGIESVGIKEFYDISSSQKRMYILNKFENSSTSYNISDAVEIEGKLDINLVEEIIQKLVKRHDAFRTYFEMVDEEVVVQKIEDEVEVKLEKYDITEERNIDQLEKAKQILKDFIKPFDLGKAPLIRVGLVRIQEEKNILIFDMHHIISDGTSLGIIIKEFIQLYKGVDLPQLKLQYKDYAAWQKNRLTDEEVKKQEKYWIDRFEDEIPVLNLPTDYIRPIVQSFDGDTLHFMLDKEISKKVEKLAVKTNTTMYMILLAVFNIVLSKYSTQEDIVVGTPVANRQHADLEAIVGMFVNTLAIRNMPQANKSFIEFLKDVEENVINAFGNQDYSFEELVEKLNISRDMSRNPMFDVMFSLLDKGFDKVELDDLKVNPYLIDKKTSMVDISVYAYEIEDTIKLEFEYCTKLYNRETIERLANAYKKVMLEVLENENIKIKEIEAISEIEKEKLLKEFNSTEANYQKEKAVHELFEEQVERNPDSIALTYESKQLTYKELNIRSNQLAETLREKGVGAESIVAVMVGRSLEMIIGILAVLKAGGGYLPIDPEYPEERISFMLEDSGTKIVLTQSEYKHNVCEGIEAIDLFENRAYSENSSNLSKVSGAAELAYVIYTSGSTGKPKGVMIEHHSLHNFIMGVADCIEFSQGTKILAVTTISFDIFALETLLPLCKGLEVVIAGEEEQTSPKLLARLIKAKEIEMLQMTPSRMALLLDEMAEGDLDCVKTLMLGGEALPEGLLKRISRCCACRIYNMYGPTETTVWSSISEMTGKTKVDIGKPIANTQMFILDSENRLCPIGVSGELCISGDGLARGYLNRQELTEEKFIRNPYASDSRIYRTGDIARWLPDGIIECLGRSDYQIKLRGYRIELGEIEEQLIKMEGIKEAAVAVKDNDKGEKYLCGYIVCDREITIKELREGLKKKLPEYMIPSHFMMLEKMPMTPNGKTDRKALPEHQANIATGWEYEAARNETEQKLVDIWQEVLEINKLSVNDNFFELGGDSLKAIRLTSKVNKMGYDIPLNVLFSNPTIKETAMFLDNAQLFTINKAKDFKSAEEIIKNETGQAVRFIQYMVNNKARNILYLETFEHCEKSEISNVVYEYCTEDIWPHYIINGSHYVSDADMCQKITESEFSKILSLKEDLSDATTDKIVNEICIQETDFINRITEQKEISTFPCSAIQKGTINSSGHMTGIIYHFDCFVDEAVVLNALARIIRDQELLRSVLLRVEHDLLWKEFEAPTNIEIPYIDISEYDYNSREKIIKEIVKQKYFKLHFGYEQLLYRFIVIKENMREYKLIAPIDHIIFDGMSGEVIVRSLREYVLKGNLTYSKEKKAFKDYLNQMSKGPIGISMDKFIEQFKSKEYKQYAEKIEKIILEKRQDTACSLEFKIALDELDVLDKIWETSFMLAVILFRTVFEVDKLPLKILYYGRNYLDEDYFDTVGYLSDIVPLLVNIDENDSDFMVRQVQETINLVKSHNLNFANLLFNSEAYKEWKELAAYYKSEWLADTDQMLLFNFQGKREGYSEVKSYYDIGNEQYEKYRLEGASFGIASYYTNEHLYINVITNLKIDEENMRMKFNNGLKSIYKLFNK